MPAVRCQGIFASSILKIRLMVNEAKSAVGIRAGNFRGERSVVNITNNPIRDQLRRARGRGKAFERTGSSRGGGILGRIEGVAAPRPSAYPLQAGRR